MSVDLRAILRDGAPPMRVALVLDRMAAARGGLESWAARFAAWLLRRGHEVHGVAFEFDEDSALPGLVRHLVPRSADRVARARAMEGRLAALPPLLVHDFGVGWRFDLLHLHGGSRRTAFRRGLRALPPRQRLRALIDRARAGRQADLERRQYGPGSGRIVALSRMVKAQLVHDYDVDAARIEVVSNGVDPDVFTPAYRTAHRDAVRQRLELGVAPAFVFVAHNFYLKGLPAVLRALARLVRDGQAVSLCVVGAGPIDAFTGLADRLGVASRVRFCGGVADPRPYLAAADVLVHPTFYDSCSLVVLEAWAMGVPAITSRWNGAHELWPEGHDDWLVDDPRDVEALTRAMRAALDPVRRETAGAVGRSVAIANSLERNFARIEALYVEALQSRGGQEG
jgi:UDP-glucose:(heptosyl)LPS alpha-1,3-glucosyltransferase